MALLPLLLSFRTADEGGDVCLHPDMHQFHKYWSKSKLLLLIHGYNNPKTEAAEAYDEFIALQQQLANLPSGGNFAADRDLVEVFWKGDDWGALSLLYYPYAVPNARQTAEALATTLKILAQQRAEGIEVEVVAHSLGTRLALETLQYIAADPRIAVTRMVFFAAAAPTFKLEDPTDPKSLRPAFDAGIKGGVRSLYSGNDIVLSWAFPIGQTFASGREGFFPTALGHERWESANLPLSLEQKENPNANHWDYWGWKKTKRKCEVFANTNVRQYLGFTGSGDRIVFDAATAERDMGEPLCPVERAIPTRQVAARRV